MNNTTAMHEAVSFTCWFACEYNVTAGSQFLERKELRVELTLHAMGSCSCRALIADLGYGR